jgi:hypothetical protein
MGLQSAVDSERESLGRKANANDVTRGIEYAKKAGINNISLDIMLGIPNHTQESLQETLNYCKSSDIKHISAITKASRILPLTKPLNTLSVYLISSITLSARSFLNILYTTIFPCFASFFLAVRRYAATMNPIRTLKSTTMILTTPVETPEAIPCAYPRNSLPSQSLINVYVLSIIFSEYFIRVSFSLRNFCTKSITLLTLSGIICIRRTTLFTRLGIITIIIKYINRIAIRSPVNTLRLLDRLFFFFSFLINLNTLLYILSKKLHIGHITYANTPPIIKGIRVLHICENALWIASILNNAKKSNRDSAAAPNNAIVTPAYLLKEYFFIISLCRR